MAMNSRFWKGRRVFVTGATGFLGGWLVHALKNHGSHVVALVRDSAPSSQFICSGLCQQTDVVTGSLADPDLLRRVISEYSVQTVFHLAGQTQVGVAKVDPISTLETNIRGSWNLLEAARQCGGVQVIGASSDKVYGNSESLPYLETHPLQGRYPYDVSKSCMDLICTMFAESYALPAVVTRCANLYGGWDLNMDRLIPGVIKATVDEEPFVIRSDGTCVRDYLYVEDAVEAYMMLAERLDAEPSLKGEAFNFSSGEHRTVIEIVSEILRLLDRQDLKPVVLNQAGLEIQQQFLSVEKAQKNLGWTSHVGFDQGLTMTIDWYRTYFLEGSATNKIRWKTARE